MGGFDALSSWRGRYILLLLLFAVKCVPRGTFGTQQVPGPLGWIGDRKDRPRRDTIGRAGAPKGVCPLGVTQAIAERNLIGS